MSEMEASYEDVKILLFDGTTMNGKVNRSSDRGYPEDRVSDLLKNETRFITVSEAVFAGENRSRTKPSTVIINKSHIIYVIPG